MNLEPPPGLEPGVEILQTSLEPVAFLNWLGAIHDVAPHQRAPALPTRLDFQVAVQFNSQPWLHERPGRAS
jgi:hypothetical protein